MEDINQELMVYGLKLVESDDLNRQKIDFVLQDEEDNIFWCWGEQPNDVDWECNHPYQCIDFGDSNEKCECLLCGSFGDYHYDKDEEGHDVPEPHEWYPRRDVGGLIGEYLKELERKE